MRNTPAVREHLKTAGDVPLPDNQYLTSPSLRVNPGLLRGVATPPSRGMLCTMAAANLLGQRFSVALFYGGVLEQRELRAALFADCARVAFPDWALRLRPVAEHPDALFNFGREYATTVLASPPVRAYFDKLRALWIDTGMAAEAGWVPREALPPAVARRKSLKSLERVLDEAALAREMYAAQVGLHHERISGVQRAMVDEAERQRVRHEWVQARLADHASALDEVRQILRSGVNTALTAAREKFVRGVNQLPRGGEHGNLVRLDDVLAVLSGQKLAVDG